eukprot:gene8066-8261_t
MDRQFGLPAKPTPASGLFQPPAAVVLVSAVLDLGPTACWHDDDWTSAHEARYDYLPHRLVGGGMRLYVKGHSYLLSDPHVSPINIPSFQGLVKNKWLLLSGGAELLARDIDRFVARLQASLGSEDIRPKQLQGWIFYPGQDGSSGDEQAAPADAAVDEEQLAQLAASKGAEAFTTSGVIIKELLPQQQWRHCSFHPRQGMYVCDSLLNYRQLQPPDEAQNLQLESQLQQIHLSSNVDGKLENQQPPSLWPPVVPGWVYFPSCSSDGYVLEHPADMLKRFRSLQDLLQAALMRPQVVAVTTEGETKSQLRPQPAWQTQPRYDVGLYVREDVARAMPAVPSITEDGYCSLYGRLQRLRCDAGQLSAVWLNDHYLSLRFQSDSPSDSRLALVLDHVWWLDVEGSVLGVPPGEYGVFWVMDACGAGHLDTNLNLSATAVLNSPCPAPTNSISPTSSASGPQPQDGYTNQLQEQYALGICGAGASGV